MKLRRRKNLDSKSLKTKSACFTEQNFFGLLGKKPQDPILVGKNDEDEMATFEFIPEIEEEKLAEKPQIQSCLTQLFKNNEK